MRRHTLLVLITLAAPLAQAYQDSATQTPPEPKAPSETHKRLELLRDFSGSLEALSTRVSRSVVQVFSTTVALGEDGEFANASLLSRQRATGSGVIVSADGLILTNGHVVQGARQVRVRLTGLQRQRLKKDTPLGVTLDAKVLGLDRESDLALIKIDQKNLPALSLGNSSELKQGQLVLAFGNPLGLENSVSMGVVSSVGRQIQEDSPMVYVQTDAPINPGNSGGPLVDMSGNVVGINTFIYSKSGGSEGIGFAIPSNIVRNVFRQLQKDGHVHRGEIGVSARTISPQLAVGLDLAREEGVVIEDVVPDSPADGAGLKVGDIVLTLDGRPVPNARQLLIQIYNYSIGDTVTLEILRGEEKVKIPIQVTEREDDPQRFADMVTRDDNLIPRLGILALGINKKLASMLPDLRYTYGVVVAARASDSPYEGAGLQPGDVIFAMNSKIVDGVDTLRKMLEPLQPGETIVFQVQRGEHLKYLVIELY